MPIDELKKRLVKVRDHLAAIDELLPGVVGLTPDGRLHSSGKFRSGEAEALASVLDAAEKKPELFTSLAALDDGFDPQKFETGVRRDRLTRLELLGAIATEIDDVGAGLDDSVLHLGDLSRPVMLSAYDIAKSHAKHDGVVGAIVRPALEYFARIGRAGAATKKKNIKPKA
jgi:hypothetical protein